MKKSMFNLIKNIIILIIFFLAVFLIAPKAQKEIETLIVPNEYQMAQNKLKNLLEDEYLYKVNSPYVESLIIKAIKKNYDIDINAEDLYYSRKENCYYYRNENSNVRITFRSTVDDMAGSLFAYALATDTILDNKTSIDESLITQSIINICDEFRLRDGFKLDENINHYDYLIKKDFNTKELKILTDDQVIDYPKKEPIEFYLQGTIEIPVYYDLSNYRKYEILSTFDSNDIQKKYKNLEDLSLKQRDLYWSYFELSGTKDYRGYVFYPLRNAGVIMYIPISGLNSNFAYGKSGSTSDIGILEELQDKSKWTIWNTIYSLEQQDLCSTRSYLYQCTSFANYWFYLQYGYDPLKGDGNHMAAALVNDLPDLFEDGCFAASGGLVSIGSANKANHVICVDAVDYQKGIITISEANTYGYANIRIRVEYTFDEFENYCLSICKAQCNGNTEGFYINYANPIKK